MKHMRAMKESSIKFLIRSIPLTFLLALFNSSTPGFALAYTSNIPSSTSSPYSTILDVQTAFDRPIFPGGERRIAIPSDVPGKEIVLPDFDVLFSQITALSPLCRQLVEGERDELRPGGFADVPLGKIRPGVDAPSRGLLSWKTVEYNERRLVFNVERLDNFLDRRAPLLRLRSRLRGEERGRGKKFSRLLTDYKLRSQWDPNCADVYEMYAPQDMADVERTMGGGLGQCIRFGVGYCRTKKNVVSPREQMTLCGVQEFSAGGAIVWGVELEDDQRHLFPPGKRLIRSRSHIFSTAIVPTVADAFDCEHVLQLEIGKFPEWLARPVLAEAGKSLFRFAEKFFDDTKA